MPRFTKEHTIDGWPICDNGEPMSKDEVVEKLNNQSQRNAELRVVLILAADDIRDWLYSCGPNSGSTEVLGRIKALT